MSRCFNEIFLSVLLEHTALTEIIQGFFPESFQRLLSELSQRLWSELSFQRLLSKIPSWFDSKDFFPKFFHGFLYALCSTIFQWFFPFFQGCLLKIIQMCQKFARDFCWNSLSKFFQVYLTKCVIDFSQIVCKDFLRNSFEDCFQSFLRIIPFLYGFLRKFSQRLLSKFVQRFLSKFSRGFQPEFFRVLYRILPSLNPPRDYSRK